MSLLETELRLSNWRLGQTESERLCAEILHVEGYKKIDPQAPLGGPDGTKDILCELDGEKWIAAAYFPPTLSSFAQVKKKFRADFKGINKHSAGGLIFMTNQRLTIDERIRLRRLVEGYKVEIYHVERIRGVLDSPEGFGMRLSYLDIPMTNEEQISFWSAAKEGITKQFLHQEMQQVNTKLDAIMLRTIAVHSDLLRQPSSLVLGATEKETLDKFPTYGMNAGQLLWLHRVLMEKSDSAVNAGKFRNVNVWIGHDDIDSAVFIPIPPVEVRQGVDELLKSWRAGYPEMIDAGQASIVSKIAAFHYGLLEIHPFLDGNGRVARVILQQQVYELLKKEVHEVFSKDSKAYYDSLGKANKGNLEPLVNLINASIE